MDYIEKTFPYWKESTILAIMYFIIGMLWYHPMIFGKVSCTLNRTPRAKTSTPYTLAKYVVIFGCMFIIINSMLTNEWFMKTNWQAGMKQGFWFGVLFVIPLLGMQYLHQRRPLGLFVIDAVYHLISLSSIGAIYVKFL